MSPADRALAVSFAGEEPGEIDTSVHTSALAGEQGLPLAAPVVASAWCTVERDGIPPCDDETVFIGINTNGFAACFNEVTQDGACSMRGPELSTCQMSGLQWWRVLDRPDNQESAPVADSGSFWLIEQGPNQGVSQHQWWCIGPGNLCGWKTNVHEATPFLSAEAAKRWADRYWIAIDYAIYSHGFMAASANFTTATHASEAPASRSAGTSEQDAVIASLRQDKQTLRDALSDYVREDEFKEISADTVYRNARAALLSTKETK